MKMVEINIPVRSQLLKSNPLYDVITKYKTRLKAGFTLIELLIVVAIIGILSAVGIPMYNGYILDSKESAAKNNLRSISLMESDYYSENNEYYWTDTGNTQTPLINTNLFSGKKVLDEDGHYYYFIGIHRNNNVKGFQAFAYPKSGNEGTKFCINNFDEKLKEGC
jgi:prepilin-type N-terminal cleavage/methylation domain-containing protein